MAARLVAVANSSFYNRSRPCTNIERALLVLGTDLVKTLVITASIKQFYRQFDNLDRQFLGQFWRRSLITANLAQVLATLSSYHSPEEAYLCGLLSDVGQLVLLDQHPVNYRALLQQTDNDEALVLAEIESFGQSHPELGAALVESWQIDGFLADAIRYQHESASQVQDAHHLVKILNLANQLSFSDEISEDCLQTANLLFGFNDALTTELRQRILNDVNKLAASLGIDIDNDGQEQDQLAQQQLADLLGDIGELAQLNLGLWQARSRQALEVAIKRSLQLIFSVKHSILFLSEPGRAVLSAYSNAPGVIEPDKQTADFTIPLEPGRSLVSDAMLKNEQLLSTERTSLSVIDRQLIRLCNGQLLVCCPLDHEQGQAGVLVFGLQAEQEPLLRQKQGLLFTLTHEIAAAILADHGRFSLLQDASDDSGEVKLKIREAVHEAGNPLSIIRNYLEMLRLKLGDEHEASEGLGLIKEEIDRVGNILLRLKEPEQNDTSDSIDINKLIERTLKIFADSIFATKNIRVSFQPESAPIITSGNPDHLKQILTNLFKNSAEALDQGGEISISIENSVSFGGKEYHGIFIQDNGPGIPEQIKRQLFKPVDSSKGEGHSGLGLSIVKKLVDELGGAIVCRSNPQSGTQFQILLPRVSSQ